MVYCASFSSHFFRLHVKRRIDIAGCVLPFFYLNLDSEFAYPMTLMILITGLLSIRAPRDIISCHFSLLECVVIVFLYLKFRVHLFCVQLEK